MFFFEKSTTNGVAMNKDEYVPTNTPIIKANENPLMDSPPNINMVSKTKNVLNVFSTNFLAKLQKRKWFLGAS